MVQTYDFMREMRAGEEAEVERLLQKAFGGNDEARLVRLLRKDGAMAGEMVIAGPGGIAGYFALSEFGAPKGWLCLAPVAVHPDHQGQRIGRRMMGLLTEWARAAKLKTPYPIEHTMLAGPGSDVPEAELVYPAAFSVL
jgi:putative acetyltransferase